MVSSDWTPTRAAGLEQLEAFVPRAGTAYARQRNADTGPGERRNVSCLSPWLRYRAVTEAEVLQAVTAAHGRERALKFIQEVFWRAYFKGSLEQHPRVWSDYCQWLARWPALRADNGGLARHYQAAIDGTTGIDCFDAWANELKETGYLHNHARMWFASIWIFTLELPWYAGAAFFLEHLLDGDPASNTLSWRWVAGLHTRGKTYLARRDNIARYTNGRFEAQGLARRAEPVVEDDAVMRRVPLQPPAPVDPGERRCGLLLTCEDLHPESLALPAPPAGIAVLDPGIGWDARAPLTAGFAAVLAENAANRAGAHFELPFRRLATLDDIAQWRAEAGLDLVVTSYLPAGPLRDACSAHPQLDLVPVLRDYDAAAWPYADRGFFKLGKQIDRLLDRCGA